MSEAAKKMFQPNPESYGPQTPKLMNLLEEAKAAQSDADSSEPRLIGWEVVKMGPYRFIGKSFYGRMGKSSEFCAAAVRLEWVFEALDKMAEYATEDAYDAALVHWEKWDEKNKLMGYTVGRFMKAETPVPEDMDYIDIPEILTAKLFIHGKSENDAIDMLRAEFERGGIYKETWQFEGEIFTSRDARLHIETSARIYGAYLPCELVNPVAWASSTKCSNSHLVRPAPPQE